MLAPTVRIATVNLQPKVLSEVLPKQPFFFNIQRVVLWFVQLMPSSYNNTNS